MNNTLNNLDISEIELQDGCGQPLARNNFRTGWWLVTARGISVRVYSSIPCNYEYAQMLADLKTNLLDSLNNCPSLVRHH